MKEVKSYNEFISLSASAEKAFLLLYRSGSEQSDCAVRGLADADTEEKGVPVYSADVASVRDIHGRFGISSVPSLLIFSKGEYENALKGCQTPDFYRSLFENAVYRAKAAAEGKSIKRVTVYSTPTCSWCNTLKTWLRKNNVPYIDVDVSRDQKASEEMVRRSGQQGVPQTDINGSIVVGFDQNKLKQLLEIN